MKLHLYITEKQTESPLTTVNTLLLIWNELGLALPEYPGKFGWIPGSDSGYLYITLCSELMTRFSGFYHLLKIEITVPVISV